MRRVVKNDEVGIHFWSDEIHRFDLRPELAAIRAPTLILGGELDPITTADDLRELAAAILDVRLEMFANAGHGVFRDNPAQALAVMREFILGQPRAARTGGVLQEPVHPV